MNNNGKKYKIVYITPSLYVAGGVERVLTLKANYFADILGYDITIILTDGFGKKLFYPISDKVKVVNLNIEFEDIMSCSFFKKVFIYLKKQHRFKKILKRVLLNIAPDITVTLMRREINFINAIKDGSKKIGEIHVNRSNYRNFESNESNFIKRIFSYFWMRNLYTKIKRLDKFVVLTNEDLKQWGQMDNIVTIPDPLAFFPVESSHLTKKRIIAIGRYTYQKGFDLLIKAWSLIENEYPEWGLTIYGQGDRVQYETLIANLGVSPHRCILLPPTSDVIKELLDSSIFAFSSRFEGFGMVLIEAMSCGLPVVSFDCPCGPKDIIGDAVDGFLVPNGNVEKLAEGLSKLMNDELLRIKMGKAARENVKRYNLENIALKWQVLFDEVCNTNTSKTVS